MCERVRTRKDMKTGVRTYTLGWSLTEIEQAGEIERCWRVWNIFLICWTRMREVELVLFCESVDKALEAFLEGEKCG